jgi:hypothetical protein
VLHSCCCTRDCLQATHTQNTGVSHYVASSPAADQYPTLTQLHVLTLLVSPLLATELVQRAHTTLW